MDKSPDAFRTISEVADDLDVPQHVLRFWDSRFTHIRPMERRGGRRYYRGDDVDLLRGIRHLLYGEGYTIRGVQRILKEQGIKFVQNVWQAGAAQPARGAAEDEMQDDEIAASPTVEERGYGGDLSSRGSGSGIERHEPRFAIPSVPRRDAVGPESSSAILPADHARKLQAVLHDLSECRRLLDVVLS